MLGTSLAWWAMQTEPAAPLTPVLMVSRVVSPLPYFPGVPAGHPDAGITLGETGERRAPGAAVHVAKVPWSSALARRRCKRGTAWTAVQHCRLGMTQSVVCACLSLSRISQRQRCVISLPVGSRNNRDAPGVSLGSPRAFAPGREQVSRRRADSRALPGTYRGETDARTTIHRTARLATRLL